MSIDALREEITSVVDKDTIARQEWLDAVDAQMAKAIDGLLSAGGERAQVVKNFLHGTWLGHPLHPVLTDVPIGAWTLTMLFDLIGAKRQADAALMVGVVSAVPTAMAGAADWHETEGQSRRVGVAHAVLNSAALGLYVGSLFARRSHNRALGVGLSTVAYAMASASAYIGGDLVYALGTGVARTVWRPNVEKFQAAARLEDLPDGELGRGEITEDGTKIPLVLLRRGPQVQALDGTCAHWGGPLADGKLVGNCVQCPWHGSQFDMRDGSVQQGPSAYPQPRYETRVRNGNVEVRHAQA